jgi:rare lipoprotein A (peptidoglycan hydrolase)
MRQRADSRNDGSGCASAGRRVAAGPQTFAWRRLLPGRWPGDNPPANIDQIPDAVPRKEPLHRGAMRPYTVMGQNYAPMTQIVPYRARGVASWYGRRYHGQKTSSGEIYDMYGMTPLIQYCRYRLRARYECREQ